MFKPRKYGIFAAAVVGSILIASPMAMADDNSDDALLQKVKQQATQGQDPQTAQQVNQYIDQHKEAIMALVKELMTYLTQMTNDNGANAQAPQMPPPSIPSPSTSAQNTSSEETSASQPTLLQISNVQPSGGLQTSDVQPSGGLVTGHLAGYPSLPDVEPISSVNHPTAEQLQYATQTQKAMQARKKELMQLRLQNGN
ncbi:MAG: hypothetical protein ABSE62_11585 [Chthoniobacteraceae bacterium]|jgi:hypothetical protein